MAKADLIYNNVIADIYMNGSWNKGEIVRTKWEDGTTAYAKAILNVQMKFDNDKEIAMLTSKRVPQKDPVNEAFWIWLFKSNDVRFLREKLGCNVWNEWERPDGTIGRAYGWQLRNKYRLVPITDKLFEMMDNGELDNVQPQFEDEHSDYVFLDQVDYLIYMLKTNPYSRRIKTTLWCVEDLDDMALPPCVYETHWQMWNGKLNLTVNVRSNDVGLGMPYNIYQYSIIHRLIAQVTCHPVGEICFNIDNAHIYDRHMDTLLEQINRPIYKSPTIEINPNVKSFYDFTIDDIKVVDYEFDKTPTKLEVAI